MNVIASHAVEIGTCLSATALAAGVGRWAIPPGSLRDRVAETVLAALAGLAALAWIMGGLLAAGVLNTPWAAASFAVWTMGGMAGWVRRPSARGDVPPPSPVPAPRSRRAVAAACLVAVSALLAVAGACAPTTAWDATYCHFAMPGYWIRTGAMPDRLDWPYYYYPLNLHMLYAAGLAAAGTTGAAMVGAVSLAAVALLSWRWASWAGGPAAGPVAALLVLSCLSLGLQADSGNVEPGLLAYGTAAMMLLARARAEGDARALTGAALATGFALGIKMTSVGLALPWLALAAVPAPFPRRRVLAAGALALLTGLPWYVRAAAATGNPFYPVMGGVFPSDHARFPTAPLLLEFPWTIMRDAVRSLGFDYAGVILALAAMVLSRRGPASTRLPAASLFILFTAGIVLVTHAWGGMHIPRFVSLAFPPLLVAGALAGVEACDRRPWLRRPGLCLALAMTLAVQGALAYRLAFKLPVILGRESRERYLSDRVNTHPLLERLNRMPDPPGRAIRVLLSDGRSLHLRREFVYGADNHGYVDYAGFADGAAFHARLRELGITHLVLNRHPLSYSQTLLNRHRMDPTFLAPEKFRMLDRWEGASREQFAPAELYEFIP